MKVSGFADRRVLQTDYLNRVAEPGERTAITMTIAIFPKRLFRISNEAKNFSRLFRAPIVFWGRRQWKRVGLIPKCKHHPISIN